MVSSAGRRLVEIILRAGRAAAAEGRDPDEAMAVAALEAAARADLPGEEDPGGVRGLRAA
jgi:hypothetical protein